MIINHFERSSNYSSGSRRGNHVSNGAAKQGILSWGNRALVCVFAIVALCCPLMARAQELSATLSGIVTDSSGAVIPHATVAIALAGFNGTARVVETDGSGNYVATNLTAGTYSITVTAASFETYKGNNIVLDVAEKHAFNVQLKTGSTSTTVVVEDNPVSVDTETSGQAVFLNPQRCFGWAAKPVVESRAHQCLVVAEIVHGADSKRRDQLSPSDRPRLERRFWP